MRLRAFSLKNYRSIRRAEKLILGDLTILIGPNNEGKSNILRGLVTGMKILAEGASIRAGRIRSAAIAGVPANRPRVAQEPLLYSWDRDYPISLQHKQPDGATTFDFQFELTPDEIEAFKKDVGSNLNGLLPIHLTLSATTIQFEIPKQGKGGATLSAKRNQIARFVASRLETRDIPSVRTAAAASQLVDEMVQRELRRVESTPEYRSAVEAIERIQVPVLEKIGSTLQGMLRIFLPEVAAVQVEVQDRYGALRRSTRLIVDDGTPTELRYKGDGVQSLAAISLIHSFSQQAAGSSELVLAIEEPEAHLHPRAIHQLRSVLTDIASRQQVVVTTHSPLLVNRGDIGSNIIVNRTRARPAKSIEEIRSILGVRVSDSLAAASVVLVVEGEDDRVSLRGLLPTISPTIAQACADGSLAIDPLHGSSNLVFKLSSLRDQLCTTHVFLDNDSAGLTCSATAEAEGLLLPADRTLAIYPGMAQSELEDLYEISFYSGLIQRRWNVALTSKAFTNRKAKWKDRMRVAFQASGQVWDDKVERAVKQAVSELVERNPEEAVAESFRSPLVALATALEVKLSAS